MGSAVLDDELIDATQRSYPLPIADAVLLCASATNLHETKDRLLVAFRAVMRVVAVTALAAQRQRPEVALTLEARQKLDKLRRQKLTDGDWIGLARGLLAPWAKSPDDHRAPELVRLFHDGRGETRRAIDELVAMRNTLEHEGSGDEADLRRALQDFVPRFARLLQAMGPLWERLRLVVALARVEEAERQPAWRAYGPTPNGGRWRRTDLAHGSDLASGTVALIDAEGRPLLVLTPLAMFRRSSPEAIEELFLLDAGKRRDVLYLSLPGGREHSHKDVWTELAALFGDGDEGAAEPTAVPTRPFRGLASFGPADAALFFGREQMSETLANRVRANAMVTVTGASGSGKTSLLHAGVGPQLTSGVRRPGEPYRSEDEGRHWVVVSLRPGPAPMASLAAAIERALPRDEKSAEEQAPWPIAPEALAQALVGYARRRRLVVVLIVDQAEELFTLGSSTAEQSAFGEALAVLGASVDLPTRVVLSLREDFFAHLAKIPALTNRYACAVQPVTAPDDDAMLRALVEPALRFGARFEEGVAETMVADVAGSLSALALLQFTADRLWEFGGADKVLTRGEYDAIGRVGGALSKHADQVIGAQTAGRAGVARRILLRLVTTEDTRAIVGRERLLEGIGDTRVAEEVLDALVGARLLTSHEASDGTATYELSHEALLSEWQALKEWREESREDRGHLARLMAAAAAWERAGRAEDVLWRGGVLAAGLAWRRGRSETVGKWEDAFLRASEAAERRSRTVRVGVTAVVMVVLAGFAVVAGLQWRAAQTRAAEARTRTLEAIREREVGRYQTLLSRARELDATHRPTEATVMLAAATRLEAALRLRGASAHADLIEHDDRILARVLAKRGDAEIQSVAFSPDGTRLATGCADQTTRVWEVSTGRLLLTLEGHDHMIQSVAFSPDGTRLATGCFDSTARVWDAFTGRVVLTIQGHASAINSIAFSPDGTRLATGSADQTVRVWEASTGRLLLTLEGHTNGIKSVSFSPDGTRLVTGSEDGTARVWEASTGRVLLTLEGHTSAIQSVAFSPDGTRLATGSWDETARVWEASTGRVLLTLEGHTGLIESVAFSPDGVRLATGSSDRTARVWEVSTGRLLDNLEGHTGGIESVAFSPDGRRLATGSNDQTARVWEVSAERLLLPVIAVGDSMIYSVAFSPDGARLVTGSLDGMARVWEASTGRLLLTLEGHTGGILSVTFSPDGTRLATGSGDRTARVWEASTGRLFHTLEGHERGISSVAFSPDGTRLVTASTDRTEGMRSAARVWEAATGRLLVTLRTPEWQGETTSVSFSPDGTRLVTGSEDRTARVWETSTWRLLHTFEGHIGSIHSVAFSPDGARLITGLDNGEARVLEASTGRLILTIHGHAREINSVAFSPDGTRLATGSGDQTARVWEASTGLLLHTLEGHFGSIRSVAFSPDGARLVTGSSDHTVRVWRTDPPNADSALTDVLRRTNLRVCLDSLEVVPVDLVPATSSDVWASSADCRVTAEQTHPLPQPTVLPRPAPDTMVRDGGPATETGAPPPAGFDHDTDPAPGLAPSLPALPVDRSLDRMPRHRRHHHQRQ